MCTYVSKIALLHFIFNIKKKKKTLKVKVRPVISTNLPLYPTLIDNSKNITDTALFQCSIAKHPVTDILNH